MNRAWLCITASLSSGRTAVARALERCGALGPDKVLQAQHLEAALEALFPGLAAFLVASDLLQKLLAQVVQVPFFQVFGEVFVMLVLRAQLRRAMLGELLAMVGLQAPPRSAGRRH
jgi:hypothetical protein